MLQSTLAAAGRTVRTMVPASSREAAFTLGIAALIGAMFFILPHAYRLDTGPVFGVAVIGGIGVCVSWISMQLIALIFEHRRLIPHEQFYGYYYGDLIGLPLVGVALYLMGRHAEPMSDGHVLLWRLIALGAGLAAGIGFRVIESHGGFYDAAMYHSPAKIWHDAFVFPVFIMLLGSKLPWVWQSEWGFRAFAHLRPAGWIVSLLFLAALATWGYLALAYDSNMANAKPRAHVQYDWGTMAGSYRPLADFDPTYGFTRNAHQDMSDQSAR